LAVDSHARRSGYALDERAARAKNRPGRQPKWVPLLPVVRSRIAPTDTPADTHAKPPLEVVAPVLAVDSHAQRSGLALDERAARAPYRRSRQPKWVPLLPVVRSRMASRNTPAGTHAKPPLEVVAPVLTVDSHARRSGFALDERAARAKNRRGRQPKWVPLLPVVRIRMAPRNTPAGTHAKPPLEVVAPVLTVDSHAQRR